MAKDWADNSGGALSPREGAPECSSMPYKRETMPTRSVTSKVRISCDGSSSFFLSKMLFLKKIEGNVVVVAVFPRGF